MSNRPLQRTGVLRIVAIAVLGFAGGRLLPPLMMRGETVVPQVSWLAAILLTLLATLIGGLAWTTYRALHQRRDRMTSPHAMRLLALAKAGIIAGAVLGGFYLGYALGFISNFHAQLGSPRVVRSGAASAAGFLLLIASVLLERACQIPDDDSEDDNGSGRASRSSPEPA